MADDRHVDAVFLFDGDCAFCSRAATLAARLVPSTPVRPWQHVDIAALGLSVADCDAAVWWIPIGGATGRRSGPDAIGALLRGSASRVVRAAGWLLRRRPVSALAWPIYRLIARHRHRLPGGTPACSLPHAQR